MLVFSNAGLIELAPQIQWPEQNPVSYIPAVRNRNGAGKVVAAGRGEGMSTRSSNKDWNVAAQTGTTPVLVRVKNNNDTGADSLREAIELATVPTDIVFDIGGVFNMDQAWKFTQAGIRLAGQTAPDQVWINTKGNIFKVSASDILIQHIAVWNDAVLTTKANVAIVNADAGGEADPANIVWDHCWFGGGTDQCFDLINGNSITGVDCCTALARGKFTQATGHTEVDHAFGGLWGENADKAESMDLVSSIGNVFALCTRRNPFSRVVNITIADHLVYGCDDAEIELSGVVADGQVTMRINIESYRSINGAGDGEIFLVPTSLGDTMATDSEIYLNDNLGRRGDPSVDEWDIVTDSDNQEADVRVDARVVAAFPDGLVVAPNRSETQADYIIQHTQSNAP